MEKVTVITVTYNSSNFISKMLDSIENQSTKVFHSIVVDNASNDLHARKLNDIVSKHTNSEIIRLKANLGGAGGFEAGLRYAFQKYPSTSWFWLMDDDAFPSQDCLSELLRFQDQENIGALIPVIYGINLKKYQLYHHKKVSRFLNKDIQVTDSYDALPVISDIETNAFVGPLISRSAIEACGFPKGSLFIYGDDTEFMYRISRRFRLILVKAARVNHRDIVGSTNNSAHSYWKTYYKYRNRILFINEFADSYITRIVGKSLVVKEILKELLRSIMSKDYVGRRGVRIKCLLQALMDGVLGRSGKRLDPKDF